MRNGWNNNPTAFQFYFTYRRLLMNHDIKNINGYYTMLNNTNILTVSSKNTPKLAAE